MGPVSMATEGQNPLRRLSINHQPPGEKGEQVNPKHYHISLPQSTRYGMLRFSQSRQKFVQCEDNQVVLERG